ncbi:MAG: polysaccharide deacetylase family protein [Rhodocyclales bacterium]|nr:polysaccharide deacetylase family protein [Rhodocyclales bacterium]
MLAKKALLASALARTGVACMALHGRCFGVQDRLTVIAYHRVMDIGGEDSFPFDPELVSATCDDFLRQMEFVRRHFTPVTFAEVVAAIEGRKKLPKRPIIVSFDDGHLDNYLNAFPVLKQLGMPATIFLATGYIGVEGTFWFDRVAELLFRANAGMLRVECLGYSAVLGDIRSKRSACHLLLEALKRVPNHVRLQALAELEETVGVQFPSQARNATLDWAQVREMSAGGIEFGSHTVSHPILTKLDDAELFHELHDSRERIRRETGQAAEVLAYPAGNAYAFDDRVIAAARQCGYKLGVSYISGVDRLSSLSHFAVRRLHGERYLSFDQFQAMLAFPAVFA